MSEDEKTRTERSSTSSEPRATKLTRPQRMRRNLTVPDEEVPQKATSQPSHHAARIPEAQEGAEAPQSGQTVREASDEPELTVQEATYRDVASAIADAGFSLVSIRRAPETSEAAERGETASSVSDASTARRSSPPPSEEGRTTGRRYAGYPASWWPPPVRSTPPPPAGKGPSFPPVGSFGPGPATSSDRPTGTPRQSDHPRQSDRPRQSGVAAGHDEPGSEKAKPESEPPRSRKATVPNPQGKPRRAPAIGYAQTGSQPPPADTEDRTSEPQQAQPHEPEAQEHRTEAAPPSPPPAPPDEAGKRARGSKPPPPPPAEARVSKPPRRSSTRKPRPLSGFRLQSVKPEPVQGSREWWEAFFSNEFLQSMVPPTDAQVARECDFVEAALELPRGSAILDVGCGLGMHATELASRGYVVVGVDIAATMVARATAEAQTRGVTARFVHADIRDVVFEGEFDAAICLSTTFGFYDDDANRDVMAAMHDALRPGGRILVDVVNRDFVIRNQPDMHWFEGPSYVCMEETEFNFYTSRLHVKRTLMHQDGAQREHAYSIRLFSLHELGQLMHRLGFRVIEASGRRATRGVFFGADSVNLILLAERRNGSPNTAEMPMPPAPAASTAEKKSGEEEAGMMQLSEDDIEHAEPVSDRPASELETDTAQTRAEEPEEEPDGDTDPPAAEEADEPQMVGVAPILQILPSLRPQAPDSEDESEPSKPADPDEPSKPSDDQEPSS